MRDEWLEPPDDERPVLCTCVWCKQPIYGSLPAYDGDKCYWTDDSHIEAVHDFCYIEWSDKYRLVEDE